MTTRRGFFKQLIGKDEAAKQEEKIEKKISLNRLRELPPHIIGQIRPVFFPQAGWRMEGSQIIMGTKPEEGRQNFELDEMELEIFHHFRSNMRLEQIAGLLVSEREIDMQTAFNKVVSLFFRLASLRICHPEEFYDIDQILNQEKKRSDEAV
jgi:hypothetical protein